MLGERLVIGICRVEPFLCDPRFHFVEGDITINREWVEYNIRKCDVVLPLVAIATPATYVREPLKVFEVDFEANLPIIRHCVKYRTRIIFPSTSEVYGMSPDTKFDPYASNLVLGPIDNGFSQVRPIATAPHSIRLSLGRGGAQIAARTFKGAIRLHPE